MDVSPTNQKGVNEELAANYNILHSQFQKLLAERNDLEESLRFEYIFRLISKK